MLSRAEPTFARPPALCVPPAAREHMLSARIATPRAQRTQRSAPHFNRPRDLPVRRGRSSPRPQTRQNSRLDRPFAAPSRNRATTCWSGSVGGPPSGASCSTNAVNGVPSPTPRTSRSCGSRWVLSIRRGSGGSRVGLTASAAARGWWVSPRFDAGGPARRRCRRRSPAVVGAAVVSAVSTSAVSTCAGGAACWRGPRGGHGGRRCSRRPPALRSCDCRYRSRHGLASLPRSKASS